jgi:hypothetical protein
MPTHRTSDSRALGQEIGGRLLKPYIGPSGFHQGRNVFDHVRISQDTGTDAGKPGIGTPHTR